LRNDLKVRLLRAIDDGNPYSHVVLMSMGWTNDQHVSIDRYNRIMHSHVFQTLSTPRQARAQRLQRRRIDAAYPADRQRRSRTRRSSAARIGMRCDDRAGSPRSASARSGSQQVDGQPEAKDRSAM
jgi:hypothetical protein